MTVTNIHAITRLHKRNPAAEALAEQVSVSVLRDMLATATDRDRAFKRLNFMWGGDMRPAWMKEASKQRCRCGRCRRKWSQMSMRRRELALFAIIAGFADYCGG